MLHFELTNIDVPTIYKLIHKHEELMRTDNSDDIKLAIELCARKVDRYAYHMNEVATVTTTSRFVSIKTQIFDKDGDIIPHAEMQFLLVIELE